MWVPCQTICAVADHLSPAASGDYNGAWDACQVKSFRLTGCDALYMLQDRRTALTNLMRRRQTFLKKLLTHTARPAITRA